MSRPGKFLLGGSVILGATAYMIYAGVSQSVVYFVTPSELHGRPVAGKAYRLGGVVAPGSLKWEPRSLDLSFTLSDGKATIPVRHKGTPPDLFAEARGAVVDGTWDYAGYFKASLIMVLPFRLRGSTPPARLIPGGPAMEPLLPGPGGAGATAQPDHPQRMRDALPLGLRSVEGRRSGHHAA